MIIRLITRIYPKALMASLTNTALIVMKNTKECALKWKNAVPKGAQENTGVL